MVQMEEEVLEIVGDISGQLVKWDAATENWCIVVLSQHLLMAEWFSWHLGAALLSSSFL